MKIQHILFIVFLRMSNSKNVYPTPRWTTICKYSVIKSENVTSWYKNKSVQLTNYLKENLDVLYM